MKITKPNISPLKMWKTCGSGGVYVPLEPVYVEGSYEGNPEAEANARAIECVPEMINWLCEFYQERPSDPLEDLLKRIGCRIED